jgi:hypothetical protein
MGRPVPALARAARAFGIPHRSDRTGLGLTCLHTRSDLFVHAVLARPVPTY